MRKIAKYFCCFYKSYVLILFVLCTTDAVAEYKYSFLADQPFLARALGINDSGTVIICDNINGSSSFFSYIYREGSYIKLLPQVYPECTDSLAFAINNRGEVVFRSKKVYEGFRYAWWYLYREGSYIDLILPFKFSELGSLRITDTNDSGIMVGSKAIPSSPTSWQEAFQYDGNTYEKISPPGWLSAEAVHINNNGTIVGYGYYGYDNALGSVIAGFLYNNGEYTELLPPGWQQVTSVAINNQGVVVLGGAGSGVHPSLSLYNRGIYTEIPLPSGTIGAEIIDINDRGEFIVNGCSCRDNFSGGCGGYIGYVYRDGGYSKLLPQGWDYSKVSGINNNGDVVGDNYYKVFIASPDKIDSDGDGVADDSDVCGDSALNSTIAMGMCDTGVPNKEYDDGCTMQDRIRKCAENSNRLTFYQCVTELAKDWFKNYKIRWNEKVKIQICAAIGKIPK